MNHAGTSINFLDQISELFAHARWARDRQLQAVPEKLDGIPAPFVHDLGDGHGSLRDKFTHIYGAEFVWFERIEGRNPTALPDPAEVDSPSALTQRWLELDQRVDGHFAIWQKAPDESLNHIIAYRTTKGSPFEQTLREILMHVVMHGMHHRGQISSMLRRLTGHVISTDLIDYYREARQEK